MLWHHEHPPAYATGNTIYLPVGRSHVLMEQSMEEVISQRPSGLKACMCVCVPVDICVCNVHHVVTTLRYIITIYKRHMHSVELDYCLSFANHSEQKLCSL